MYEVVGYLSAIIVAVSYFTTDKVFVALQTVSNILISLSFLMQGLYLSTLGTAIATIRTITLGLSRDKRVLKVSIFCILHALVSLIGYDTMYDLIYLVGLEMFTLAFLVRDTHTFRCTLIVPNLLYIVYKLCVGSIGSMIGTLIETIAILIYIFRRKYERVRTIQIIR